MIRIGIIRDTRGRAAPRCGSAARWGLLVFAAGLVSLLWVGHARAVLPTTPYPGGDPADMPGDARILPTEIAPGVWAAELTVTNIFGPLNPPVTDPALTDLHLMVAWQTAGVSVATVDAFDVVTPLPVDVVVGPIEDEGGSVTLQLALDTTLAPVCADDPTAYCGGLILSTDQNRDWGDTLLETGTEVYAFELRTPSTGVVGGSLTLSGGGLDPLQWTPDTDPTPTVDLGEVQLGESASVTLTIADASDPLAPRTLLSRSDPGPGPWSVAGLTQLPRDLELGPATVTLTCTPTEVGEVTPYSLVIETDISCPDYPNQGVCSNAVTLIATCTGVLPETEGAVRVTGPGVSPILWTPEVAPQIDLGEVPVGEWSTQTLTFEDATQWGAPRTLLDAVLPDGSPWEVRGLDALPYDLEGGPLEITVTCTPELTGTVAPLLLTLGTDIGCDDYPGHGTCRGDLVATVTCTGTGSGAGSGADGAAPDSLLILRRAVGGSAALWSPQYVAVPTTIGESCIEGDRAWDVHAAELYLCGPDGWLRYPATRY